MAVGFAYCLSGLIVTTDPWPFIVGLALIALPYAILFHVLLAFPTGRIGSRGARALAAVAYAVATVGWWACLVLEDTGAFGLPANPLLIADEPGAFDALSRGRLAIVAVLIAALLAVLARRLAAASRAQRRALLPVYVSGGLVLLLYAVWAVFGVLDAAPGTQETLEEARIVALAIVPFAFLAGLLRSRVAGAIALAELVARLGGETRRGAVRDALADALGDHTLELAYWLPEAGEWVDASGARFEARRGRAQTPVELDGRPVALLVHETASDDDRELVRAVGAAAALALENERLDAELRANVKELRASRARIVESADAARRKLERDLHDGAQQQLVALALHLRIARSRVDRDPAAAGELLEAAAAELDTAIRELRELARGIHPAVLSDHGLVSALESLAGRLPLPVEIDADVQERLPRPVEAAAYFVVAEAMTNVARYSGADSARISVVRQNGAVVVRVSDDGTGGADPADGSGLRGLADRVAALDGRLRVDSPPGVGTTVEAIIPA